MQKTDHFSKDSDVRFRADKKNLVDKVQRLHDSYRFIFDLQIDLIKNISFSTNLNFRLFNELFVKYESAMKIAYGQLSAEELYRVLDEDEDGYLNEDEQLLLFVLITVQTLLLYEECIFFGHYDGVRKLEKIEADLGRVIIDLQTSLRCNLYKEQLKKFEGNRDQIEGKHVTRFDRRMADFKQFREAKTEELQHTQMDKRFSTMLAANTRVGNFNFTKYSALQDIRIQEKFLSIFGNIEEAKNLQKTYKKIFSAEQTRLGDKINKYTVKVSKNLEDRFNFQNNMLEYKLNLQEASLNQDFTNSKDLLLKKMRAQENKIKKLQSHLNHSVNANFFRQTSLNKIKVQGKLKRDIYDDVKGSAGLKVYTNNYHSTIYKKHFSSSEQSKIKETDLQRLISCRDSFLNYRFNLRRFDETNKSLAKKACGKDNNLKRIHRLINSTQLEQKKENKLCLAKYYDDHLRLISETD